MPVPGTQVTLTLGVESTIPTPSGIVPSVGQSWSVEIENVSPWVLTVNVSGKPYNLAPGMGQLYVSTSGPASVTVIPSGSAASGSFYVLSNWAVAPDHIPGTFPVVVAPSLTGSIIASQPQAALTGSPLSPTTGGSHTFTWPVGEPYSSVLLVLSGGSAVSLSATGATTGATYLPTEVIDHGVWRLDISSVAEPDGVTVTYARPYGYAGAWTPTLTLVAMVAPEIVRPVYGPGDSGPTAFASASVGSNGNVVLAGNGSKTSTLRVWSAWLSANLATAGAACKGQIEAGGSPLLVCTLGGAAGTQDSISTHWPGGLPIGLSLTTITLNSDNVAGLSASGGIAYSVDST